MPLHTHVESASEENTTLLGMQTRHAGNITLTRAASGSGAKQPETTANEAGRSEDAPLCSATIPWKQALTAARTVADNAQNQPFTLAVAGASPPTDTAGTVRFTPGAENVVMSSTALGEDTGEPELSPAERRLRNVLGPLLRCILSVGIPTCARELVRFGVLSDLGDEYLPALKIAGCCASLLPFIIQSGGLGLDYFLQRSTSTSVLTRVAGMVLVAWSSYQLWVSDRLTSVAPALIAAEFVYVLSRDFIQFFLLLVDNNSEQPSLRTTLLAAGIYGINQILVDILMSVSAAALANHINIVAANAIARPVVNILGEVADELTYRSLGPAKRKNGELEIVMQWRQREEITLKTIVITFFTTLAARATLFSLAFGYVELFASDDITATLLIGLMSVVGYVLFIGNHVHSPEPAVAPAEDDPSAADGTLPVDVTLMPL
ncbi:hypothetical protein [Sodalis sp. (in: enterobacteria)]|uniref:hypothetical protein n=1 Tax=Sodalis sp. (in: enterobacteria) TaxID=1898979 RepID=UPI003F3AC338